MAAKQDRTHWIEDLEQIRALATPARQEIVDALEVLGPSPVAAIAALLGRAPDSLYHHVRVLERVGLVRRTRIRRRGRSREAVYDLSNRSLGIRYELADGDRRRALNAVIRGMTRIAIRDFERATEKGDAVVEGPQRNLRGSRLVGRLDAKQTREVNRLFEKICDIFARPTGEDRPSNLLALTFLLVPLERKADCE